MRDAIQRARANGPGRFGLSARTSANLLLRRAGTISEEKCSTVSDQISSEFDKVMVICKNDLASIYGSFGLQESADPLRAGKSTLSETTPGEPICHAVLSQQWIMAVSQLLRLHYTIFQGCIAAFSCNPPGVKWIGPHCAEAK